MKKLFSMFLCMALLLSMAAPVYAAEPKSEAQTAGAYLVERGILQGSPSGDLMLEKGLNRAELAAILARLCVNPEHVAYEKDYYARQCKFTDVPDWARRYVGVCVANSLMEGYGDGRFGANDSVTPAAAATVMLRYIEYFDSPWDYSTACDTALEMGLLPTEMAEQAAVTRGDTAILIYRAMGNRYTGEPQKGIEDVETPSDPQSNPLSKNPDGSINPPSDGSQYIPQVGDVIRCDDGTNYTITDVSRWDKSMFASGPIGDLPEPTCDWSLLEQPELPAMEVRRFSDEHGDDLFVRNLTVCFGIPSFFFAHPATMKYFPVRGDAHRASSLLFWRLLMKKRILTMLLSLIMLFGLFPPVAFAADTPEDALGAVNVYNGGTEMSYLSINGRVQTQTYTYYNYRRGDGDVKEIPAYCVNPNTFGVPQTVAPGESIEYLADEKATDPKVQGIVANGYPTRGLGELKLENKYHAYYATKMALWCLILPSWDISNLKVNSGLTGVELTRAQSILAAAKDIYTRGTAWNEIMAPEITCTPDRDNAYPVTIDGVAYKQQVFTFWSKTWVRDYAVSVAFSTPENVPAGTRIVNMENKDITTITTAETGDGYAGKFKVLYPADSIAGETGSAQLSFGTNVYKYAVFYAVCAETDLYGAIQNYMVDTDPTLSMQLSTYSNYAETPTDTPDTGLKIRLFGSMCG